MRKVVGYVRGSTVEQQLTLEDQEDKLRSYAAAHQFELVELIVDRGASGKSLRRPGMKQALALLDDGRAEGLLVAKLDRLTRSTGDFARLLQTHFGSDKPHLLISAEAEIDTKTPAGRLPLRILMAVYEWEREVIGERTTTIVAHKRTKGEQLGTVPIGKTRDATSSQLVDCPEDVTTVALIYRLRAEGRSLAGIAHDLDLQGIAPKKGGLCWSKSTVQKVLSRPCPT